MHRGARRPRDDHPPKTKRPVFLAAEERVGADAASAPRAAREGRTGSNPAPLPRGVCVRERRGPVSWLEAAALGLPGAGPQWRLAGGVPPERRRTGERDRRASYSGGAAPESHRLPNGPSRYVL